MDNIKNQRIQLMSVKLLFITGRLNKSLLSLQRQRSSWEFVTKGLSVWNFKVKKVIWKIL